MKHKPSSGHWRTVTRRDPRGLCWLQPCGRSNDVAALFSTAFNVQGKHKREHCPWAAIFPMASASWEMPNNIAHLDSQRLWLFCNTVMEATGRSVTQCPFYRDTQRKFWQTLHSRKMPELLRIDLYAFFCQTKRKVCNSVRSSLLLSCQEMQTQTSDPFRIISGKDCRSLKCQSQRPFSEHMTLCLYL